MNCNTAVLSLTELVRYCPWQILSLTISLSLLKLMSIESVMPSHHLILRHPHLLLPLIFPSIVVFSSESALHIRWLTYWSFTFSISPSNDYSALISFRIDYFDLLAVQRTLKLLLQSVNSLAFSFTYSPTLTSIHDYWKNHSLDYTDLCWPGEVSAFLICCLSLSQLFFHGASVF